MNLVAKLRIMLAEIDALKARVAALEKPDPWPGAVPMDAADSLTAPIVDHKPIASATIAPPPKKRGRPPKA